MNTSQCRLQFGYGHHYSFAFHVLQRRDLRTNRLMMTRRVIAAGQSVLTPTASASSNRRIPTLEDDFMESIKYEPKRRKSVIVKAMHFLKRKYCQFDEFIIPLLLNDIPLLAGRCVIFHLESKKKNSQDPQTRLWFKFLYRIEMATMYSYSIA